MTKKTKDDVKKKCCQKFIKKEKHCSKCPAAIDKVLKKSLLAKEAEKKSKPKKDKKKDKKK